MGAIKDKADLVLLTSQGEIARALNVAAHIIVAYDYVARRRNILLQNDMPP